MQGQRGTIGSLTDTINFEFESQTTNVDMDPQLCWNDLRSPSENPFIGNINQDGQTLSRWNTVGSSSTTPQNLVGQIGWSPPINTSIGVNFVSQPVVNLNLTTNDNNDGGPTFVRGSTSGSASQNFDLNEGRKFHHSLSSGNSSGNGVFPVEDGDGGSSSSSSRPLDGRRVSCKRKNLEGDVGQSSSAGGGNGGNFLWRPFDASSSMNMVETPDISPNAGLPEEVDPRLGLGIGVGVGRESRDSSSTRPLNISGERSHRNYRLRMSSSSSSSPVPPPPVPRVQHQALRFVPMNPPTIDLMSTPISSETSLPPPPPPTTTPQNQPATFAVPSPMQRGVQTYRWNGLRHGPTSSTSDDTLPDDSSSRGLHLPTNIGDHPVFTPPIDRSLGLHSTHWSSSGSGSSGGMSRNTGSSSRSRSNARSQTPGGASQDSHRHHTQYSRRLSEYVRRSLLAAGHPEITGQHQHQHQHRSVPAASQEGVPSSGAGTGIQGSSHSHSRSALWLERQGDGGAGGIPYLRALAAAGEGRSRIVSEIRNALNSIRRGEGLRIEDLMLLDQSIYFGRAEIHDQHRDMRLDVDNMSYEELLALEERIGNVCTGLSEEMIIKSLKERKHVLTVIDLDDDDQTEAEPCCVCQEVYKEGEDIGTLDCGHDFHRDCIKQWLSQKNICPICKTTGLATK